MNINKSIQDLFVRVEPAYDRKYDSLEDAVRAWHSGSDFKIIDPDHRYFGAYVNKDDAERFEGIKNVMLYWKSGASPVVIPVQIPVQI